MSLGSCCVVGATGQTGSAMVRELLGGAEARATRVVAFGNSRLPTYSGPRAELLEARQAPMEALASSRRSELVGFDSLFIHVGTQRGKVGLQKQIELEYDHTLEVAKAALAGGCRACHLVSSVGASSSAGVTYLRTKGRIEEALKALGFARLLIYRPACLVGGDRDKPGVKRSLISVCTAVGLLSKIDVNAVATAMRVVALRQANGTVEVFENSALLSLAGAASKD